MNSSTPEKSPGTKSPYKTISSRFISTRLVSIFLFRSASSVQLTLVVVSMSVVNFHEIFAWNHVFYFVLFRFGVRTMRYIPSWHMHSILNRFPITMTILSLFYFRNVTKRGLSFPSFKAQGDKTTGESRHFGFHKGPSTPRSQRKDEKHTETVEQSKLSCCEKARAQMKYNLRK